MSKIIKAFEITGEYRLSDVKINNDSKNSYNTYGQNNLKKKSVGHSDFNLDGNINEQLGRARQQAEEIISAATKKAAKIIEDAEKEAQTIQEKAYEKGFNQGQKEGRQQGYKEGMQQIQENTASMNDKLDQARKDLKKQKQELPQTVINLAVQIAGRVVNTGLDINPGIINNIIIDMLEDVGSNYDNIIIKVNPDFIQHINEFEIESRFTEINLEFEGDSTLEYGDCVLETEFGGRDGTVENKLDLLEQQLYKEAALNET